MKRENNFKISQMIEEEITIVKMRADLTLWICDIDFWMDDLEDCQKTLEDNLVKIDELEEKKRLEQFQNQIIYYTGELLPEFKKELAQQQIKLEGTADVGKIAEKYHDLDERGAAIHEQMKERRRQIDLFINNI